jgi:hypothetical protein
VGLFSRRRLVEPTGSGRYLVRLDATERQVLGDVCAQLIEALDDGEPDDAVPAFRRLFPVAHASDAELEAQYQSMIHDELRAKRIADLRTVVDGIEARDLDQAQLERWMTAVNAVRLVFGTMLDVSEDDHGALDPDDPDTPALVVYHFLGQVLEDVVSALTGSLDKR